VKWSESSKGDTMMTVKMILVKDDHQPTIPVGRIGINLIMSYAPRSGADSPLSSSQVDYCPPRTKQVGP
jgi:hypothetical protein